MKTIARKIQVVCGFTTAEFMRIKSTNELREVKFVSLNIPLDDSLITYTYRNDGKDFTLSADEFELYERKYTYQDGQAPYPLKDYEPSIDYDNHIYTDKGNDEIKFYSWKMIDQVPALVDAPITCVKIVGFNQIGKFVYEDGVNINEYYRRRADALLYNSFKYTDQDGVEHIEEGKAAFTLLNDKQMKAMQELKKAIEKVEKADIRVALDCEYGKLIFMPEATCEIDYDSRGESDNITLRDIREEQTLEVPLYNFYENENVFKAEPKQNS